MNINQSFTPAHKHTTVKPIIIFLPHTAHKQNILQVHFYIIQTENLENKFKDQPGPSFLPSAHMQANGNQQGLVIISCYLHLINMALEKALDVSSVSKTHLGVNENHHLLPFTHTYGYKQAKNW